ncbi:hypothetical protein LXL04_017287 [Taraxacum kok-saghyz]
MASSTEFQPQWLKNPPTAGCCKISTCGAQSPTDAFISSLSHHPDKRLVRFFKRQSNFSDLSFWEFHHTPETYEDHRFGVLTVKPPQTTVLLRPTAGAVLLKKKFKERTDMPDFILTLNLLHMIDIRWFDFVKRVVDQSVASILRLYNRFHYLTHWGFELKMV